MPNEAIKQLRELDRFMKGALQAAEQDQPALAYALLDSVSLSIQNALRVLRLQSVDKWGGIGERHDAA